MRLSPNVWSVGDTVKLGAVTFRAVQVYPEVLFEAVTDGDFEGSESGEGVPPFDGREDAV